MLFNRLDKYIFTQALYGLLIALSAICVAIILVDLVEQLRAISGIKDAGFGTALYFTGLRLPGLVQQTTPLTVLIASILTFTGLSRRSEIIAMRSAGISAWRFLAPLGTLAVGLGLVIVLIIGPIAAQLNQKYENIKSNLNSNIVTTLPNSTSRNWTTMPTKNGQVIIYGTLENLNNGQKSYKNGAIFEYQKDGINFIRRIDARDIIIGEKEIIANNAMVSATGIANIENVNINIELSKDSRDSTNMDVKSLPIWEIPDAAKKAKASGGSPNKFWLQFYKLLALPITMLSMALFAGLMSIGLDRSGGKIQSVAIAIFVGFLMFFLGDMTGLLATSGILPPFIAAFCPPIFILAATLAFFSMREDGEVNFND